MTNWITNRPPTRADADINGQIVARHDGLAEGESLQFWNSIRKAHWRHTSLYRHTIEPAPEPPAAEPASDPGLSCWITNRQPTIADGDCDGDVRVRKNPSSEQNYTYLHWSYVGAGLPWRHSEYWCPLSDPAPEPPAAEPEPQPAPEPAATDRPALAVGQTWRRRDGEVVTIVKNDGTDGWPFQTSNGDWYTINGFYLKEFYPHERDFVELISEAPEPAPVTPAPEIPGLLPAPEISDIPEAIRAGVAPFYVVVTPDDSGGAGGGHLMAWEAQIPEGSTLQSVLRRQAHIVRHYGTTYIAECRIVPSLTSGSPAQQLRPESGPVVTPPATATEPRQIRQLLRTRNPDGSHTLDAIDDGGVAWVLYPGTGRWEELIHLPARRVPVQQPQP